VGSVDFVGETPALSTVENPEFQRFFMYMVTAFTAIGGFLFGYDTGVISGPQFSVNVHPQCLASLALVPLHFHSRISICFSSDSPFSEQVPCCT
jgi:hypothetical protein